MTETATERQQRRALSRSVVRHTVPLAPDGSRNAELLIPRDLTPDEAERFAAFIKAVALPD